VPNPPSLPESVSQPLPVLAQPDNNQ
jgi:hypothetical protein